MTVHIEGSLSMNNDVPSQRSITMEILFPLIVLAIWFIMNAWVLPRFGVQT